MPDERSDRNLPVVIGGAAAPAPLLSFPAQEREPAENTVPLSHYLWIVKRHRWMILCFVFTCVVATLVVSSRITPIYESTATVDIDRAAPSGVMGQEANFSYLTDSDQFMATQVRLIQSDSVLRPVDQTFHLVEHEEKETPLVKSLDPVEAPVKFKDLKVTRPPNTYLLLISFRSKDPRRAADVSNAIANSYLQHTYNIRFRSSASLSSFMEKQLDELKAKMEKSSEALGRFERELNVINPEEKTSIMSARLLQLNTEFTNAQVDRAKKEAAYNSVRSGSMEAAIVSSQGEALKKLAERQAEAEQKFAEVKSHYGVNHPEYKKAAAQVAEVQRLIQTTRENIARRVEIEFREAINKEKMLQQSVQEQKNEFDRINARSFEYRALKQEAEADKKFYDELVRKIKEAGINANFKNNSIRIADAARPALRPVSPNIRLNVLLAFIISTLIAVSAALVSDLLDTTMRDPEKVMRALRCEVVGTLPVVKDWKGRIGIPSSGNSKGLVRVGDNHRVSGFRESVRTLRNSILLADFDRRLRSLLLTSATPGEGKSTIAVHLAISHAEQNHRTLLIDADLRRPSLQRRLGFTAATGLSNVILSDMHWKDAVLPYTDVPNLDILPAGPSSRRAADLLGKGLGRLLEEANEVYDLVILDSPPLLGFAEPLQMATAVDGVIVVALADKTNRKAVSSVLQTLGRLRAHVVGVVLNEVSKDLGESYYYYGYGYGYYHKYYAPKGDRATNAS